MSVMSAVREAILQWEPAEPFTTRSLLHLGSRAAVDQALSRLVREGTLRRVVPGIFARPKFNEVLGLEVPPSVEKVVALIAAETGETVQIQGAAAANAMGLSLQVPMKPVYHTTGPSRSIWVGRLEVLFRHRSLRKLALAGTGAGFALSALEYLGSRGVEPEHLAQIKRLLPVEEWKTLLSHPRGMPGWLSAKFSRFELEHSHA